MAYRSCTIVLVGRRTAERTWVKYEIGKAWNDGKGLFGIYIHNLKCPRTGTCAAGANPFDGFTFKESGQKLSSVVPCYNPTPASAYADIKANLAGWVEAAISSRKA